MKIQPVENDLVPILDTIANFIKSLSLDVLTKLRNLPERDS